MILRDDESLNALLHPANAACRLNNNTATVDKSQASPPAQATHVLA